MKRFRYGRDPICLIACALYLVNRFAIKPITTNEFIHGHFNDLLLIPGALPWVLLVQRLLNLRRSENAPSGTEILFHTVVWSLVCEWIGPHVFKWGTADWRDCLAYAVGALVSWALWNHAATKQPARI